LRIVQVTDTHYKSGVNEEIVQTAIKKINKIKGVDFVIFTGDNIDKSNEDDLINFLEMATKVKRPYYIMMGNHDAYKFSGIPKDTFVEYVQAYNRHQPKPSFKYNYKFSPKAGILVVMLDGATPMIPSSHGYFQEATLKYFDKLLTKNKDKKVLIFQHFPVIIPTAERKNHNILEVEKYQEILDKHDNVVLIASGHYHENKETIDKKGVHHISTTSLGHCRGFNIIDVNYSKPLFNPATIKEVKVTHIDL